MSNDGKHWFTVKRFGYGAGLPIRWQGWALLLGYLALMLACAMAFERGETALQLAAALVLALATFAVIAIARERTRGQWRWRWGMKD